MLRLWYYYLIQNGGGEGTLTHKFLYGKDYVFVRCRTLDALACTQVVSAPSSFEARLSIAMQLLLFRFH